MFLLFLTFYLVFINLSPPAPCIKLRWGISNHYIIYYCYRFVQVCSLSDLLQHMSDSDTNSQGTSSSEPTLIDLESNGSHDQADGKSADGSSQPVQLVFDDSTQHFHNAGNNILCFILIVYKRNHFYFVSLSQ